MENKDAFPLDIETIKQCGIAQWQRDFFWPVSDEEYVSLSNDIESVARGFVEEEQKRISDVLLQARGLRTELQHFLHAILVLQRIKARGLDPVCLKDTPWFSRLLCPKTEGGDVSSERFLKQHLNHERGLRRTIISVKKTIREVQCNSLKKFLASLRDKKKACTFGAPYGIIKDYIKRFPYWVSITYPTDWTRDAARITVDPALEAELHEVCAEFFDAICGVAKKYSILLTDESNGYIFTTIKRHLSDSAQVLKCVRGKGRVYAVEHFIAPNLRNPIQLAIALAVREHGGKVTSFTHGGHVGLFQSPTMAMSEFALADEFVMFSAGSRPLFEKIYASKKPPFENEVAFTGSKTTPFLYLKKGIEKRSSPQDIKTIMMAGFPYSVWRKEHPGSGLFWAIRLDFELRMVRTLSKLGYQVLYKVHPDREKEVAGIFDAYATVVKGDVRELLDTPDAFFFGAPRTTAIAYALCTAKPIAICMLKSERPYAFSDALERLEKRCNILSTWFDERNRIQFDERDLKVLFTEQRKRFNTEYVDNYLFPSRV